MLWRCYTEKSLQNRRFCFLVHSEVSDRIQKVHIGCHGVFNTFEDTILCGGYIVIHAVDIPEILHHKSTETLF